MLLLGVNRLNNSTLKLTAGGSSVARARDPRDKYGNARDPSDTAYTYGDTSDGVRHHTWFDGKRNRRISYDTRPNSQGEHVYIPGTGHEVDQRTGKVVDRWG